MPSITFETEAANYEASAIALRSLTKEYTKLNRVIVQTEKQLLKFDEINRLVAYADKPASAGRSSSGCGLGRFFAAGGLGLLLFCM